MLDINHIIHHTTLSIPFLLRAFEAELPVIAPEKVDIQQAIVTFQDIRDNITPFRLVVHAGNDGSPFQIFVKGGGSLALVKACLTEPLLEFAPASGVILPRGEGPEDQAMPLTALNNTADFVRWSRLLDVARDRELLSAGDNFGRRFRSVQIPVTTIQDNDRKSEAVSRLLANL